MINPSVAKLTEWASRWMVLPEMTEGTPLKRKNGKLYVRYDTIEVTRRLTTFIWKTRPVAMMDHAAVAEPNTTLSIGDLKGLLQIHIK